MIVLIPIFWLLLWAAISVVTCAFLGLTPAQALRTGTIIFLGGGCLVPILAWLIAFVSRRIRQRR